MTKVTLEQKKKAVQIAVDGGNPKEYLRKLGVKAPDVMWAEIKKKVKEVDPPAYAKLMEALAGKQVKKEEKPEETVPEVKDDGPIRIEMPEANKVQVMETPEKISAAVINPKVVDVMDQLEIRNPLVYDGMIVREIEGQFGRYRHSAVGDKVYIDFESSDRLDTISLTVEQWQAFRKEQQKAGRILGVEL